jgi:signal transduction histidine kinase
MADISAKRDPPPSRTLLQDILHDRVLVVAFVVCAVLIGYQLTITLVQPTWIKPATDWLRTLLAWPQLLVVAWVAAVRIRHTQRRDAVVGCCLVLGMLSYAIARTSWTIADVIIYPHGVPFPSAPDLFFILQYPFFIAALFLFHAGDRWLPGVRVIVDGVLWMSAVTALSWYFVLLPLSLQTQEQLVSKNISMYYQICDLVLFYGLLMALARAHRTTTDRLTFSLLSAAVMSLFIADTWAALLLLHRPYTYRSGSAPDLFWFTAYLLLPLVSLVRLRLTPAELQPSQVIPAERLTWRDVLASIRLASPGFAVVTAGVVILVHSGFTLRPAVNFSAPEVVGIGLLVLATLQPAVVFLEQEQLRRERDLARSQERALRIVNARMEAFLSMVAHELRTPLTSLSANVQLMGRRLDTLLRLVRNGEEYTDTASVLRDLILWSDQGLERMRRMIEDVLDDTRVQQGRLTLRLEACDLVSVVGRAVAEQMEINPGRSIQWVVEVSNVPVLADAGRIEQVVTSYVSNALKFSRSNQAVKVRVQSGDREALVSVHDDGVGIPLADQPHIWERFYQGSEADIQSGSQVGFGIGLCVSKAIIEEHRGRVGVDSTPGQGTTLWFALPVTSAPASTAPEAGAGSRASVQGPGEQESDSQ